MTEQQYNDAIAIYNPNGGHRVGKIYDVRDTAPRVNLIRFSEESGLDSQIFSNLQNQIGGYHENQRIHRISVSTDNGAGAYYIRWNRSGLFPTPNGCVTSFYVKSYGVPVIGVHFSTTPSAGATKFDLVNGTVGNIATTTVDCGITDEGDGWYRVWLLSTQTSVSYFNVGFYDNPTSGSVFTPDGTGTTAKHVEIRGFMQNDGPELLPYDLTPKRDLTVGGGGGTRINKAGQVEDVQYNKFSNSNYGLVGDGGGTVISSNNPAPDGSNTAYLTQVGTSYTQIRQLGFATGAGNLSIYAKYHSGGGILLMYFGTYDYAEFNIQNGSIVKVTGSKITSHGIEDVGNGWYRCWIAKDSTATEDIRIRYNNTSSTDAIYSWGVQYVEGDTSLRPLQITTGSAAFPKINYSTGRPAFLIEPAMSNRVGYSYDLITDDKFEAGSGVNWALSEAGITGKQNTGLFIEDTNTGSVGGIYSGWRTFGNTLPTIFSFWVKKDSNESRFPHISISTGTTQINISFRFNTKTGEILSTGGGIIQSYDRGLWWEINCDSVEAIDRFFNVNIRPAYSSSWEGQTNTTGAIILGHFGVYQNAVMGAITPIITNGSAVTRTGNYYYNVFGGAYSIDDNWLYADVNLLDTTTPNQTVVGMDGDPSLGTVRAAYGLDWTGTEWKAHMRPSNTAMEEINTGITTPRVKVAMNPKKARMIINGIVFTCSDNRVLNSGFSEITVGRARRSGNWFNTISHCEIYNLQLLSSIHTEQEMITLTTL